MTARVLVKFRLTGLIAALTLMLTSALVQLDSAPALASDGSQFDAGNIMSDAVFFDPGSMSVTQIDQFLRVMGKKCVPGSVACLKDYWTVTVAKAAEQDLCKGYQGGLAQTSAQIVAGVAASCGINPRVLLVLLQKEQGLVTTLTPTPQKYQSATGFGCPDTAPCDSQFYGFFNQLYQAARQYKRYAKFPASYGHVAGRVNTIRYHPNAACGTSPVYIANQATAGLYNYTPYRPNTAALNNVYGLGDGCSSYGNRNFWRTYQDWFGSTQAGGGYLLRTVADSMVYLVTSSVKYPINSMDILGAYSALGPVGYVSQAYLDQRPTGPALGRMILAADSMVYLVDGPNKYGFSSCALVQAFGYSCPQSRLLDDSQIAAFFTGPVMSANVQTIHGQLFNVSGGRKYEVVDQNALAGAGLAGPTTLVTSAALSYLPYGPPVVRANIGVQSRTDASRYLIDAGALVPLSPGMLESNPLRTLPAYLLDGASITAATKSPNTTPIGVFARASGTTPTYLLEATGKSLVTDPNVLPAVVPQLPSNYLDLFTTLPARIAPVFIKTATSSAVYYLDHGVRRSVPSWTDLLQLNAITGTSPRITTLTGPAVSALPTGPDQLGPGSLVISPTGGGIYMIDGPTTKIPMASWARMANIGAGPFVTRTPATLDAYTTTATPMTIGVQCATTKYIAIAGILYPITHPTRYTGLPTTTLDPTTCAVLTRSTTPAPQFLRLPTGQIYYIENGYKRDITTYQHYLDLGGTNTDWITTNPDALATIPTGPNI